MPRARRLSRRSARKSATHIQITRSFRTNPGTTDPAADELPPGEPGTAHHDEGRIDAYVNELAHRLGDPAPDRAGILSEITDGLMETVDSYRSGGLCGEEAARAAIAEFGRPHEVAAAFRPELGVRHARRTALALMISGPLVGIAWLTGAVAASLPPVRQEMPWMWWALPLVGLALVVAVPSLMLTVVSTGRLGLRLALPASLPSKAVGIASAAAVAADIVVLAMFSLYALSAASLPVLPLVPAIAASSTRIYLAARASRHCLAATTA